MPDQMPDPKSKFLRHSPTKFRITRKVSVRRTRFQKTKDASGCQESPLKVSALNSNFGVLARLRGGDFWAQKSKNLHNSAHF